MYLRPGFVVVIVGATLTSLSTIVVALRYIASSAGLHMQADCSSRYYCRHVLMGSIGASDHLMLVALVLSWCNFVTNYYQDETSSRFRPSFFRIPVSPSDLLQSTPSDFILGKATTDRGRSSWFAHHMVGIPYGLHRSARLRQAEHSVLLPRDRFTSYFSPHCEYHHRLRRLIYFCVSRRFCVPVRESHRQLVNSWVSNYPRAACNTNTDCNLVL